MTNINFWTPIQYVNPNKDWTEALIETVDDYFYLSGSKATVLETLEGRTTVIMMEGKEKTCLETCLKIASYFTIVIPVLMLLAKMLTRVLVDEYQINQELSELMPTNPKIIDFYVKKNVFAHFNRPLEVDLNSLDLPLDQLVAIDPNHFEELVRPMVPRNKTLRDVATEVIGQINAKIGRNPAEKLETNRTVQLSTQAPWMAAGTNLYFYNRDKLIPASDTDLNSLDIVLNKLVEKGHIFSWNANHDQVVIKV